MSPAPVHSPQLPSPCPAVLPVSLQESLPLWPPGPAHALQWTPPWIFQIIQPSPHPRSFMFILLNTLKQKYFFCTADLQLLPSFSAPSVFAAMASPNSHPMRVFFVSIPLRGLQMPHLCPLLSTPSQPQPLCLPHSQCPWATAISLNKPWHIIPSSSVRPELNLKPHFYLNKEALALVRLKALFTLVVWCSILNIRASGGFLRALPSLSLHIFPPRLPFSSHQLSERSFVHQLLSVLLPLVISLTGGIQDTEWVEEWNTKRSQNSF